MAKWLTLSYQAQGFDQAALDAYLQIAKAGRLDANLTTEAAILAEQLQAWPVWQSSHCHHLGQSRSQSLLNAWVKQGQYEALKVDSHGHRQIQSGPNIVCPLGPALIG